MVNWPCLDCRRSKVIWCPADGEIPSLSSAQFSFWNSFWTQTGQQEKLGSDSTSVCLLGYIDNDEAHLDLKFSWCSGHFTTTCWKVSMMWAHSALETFERFNIWMLRRGNCDYNRNSSWRFPTANILMFSNHQLIFSLCLMLVPKWKLGRCWRCYVLDILVECPPWTYLDVLQECCYRFFSSAFWTSFSAFGLWSDSFI